MLQKNIKYFIVIQLIFILYTSCSPTKYLEQGEYIVNNVKIDCSDKKVKTRKLKTAVQPAPLKKFLKIYAYRVRIYNIPNPKKDAKREQRRDNKIKRKNKKIDARFDNKSNRMRKKRNRLFNKVDRVKQSGDSVAIHKAEKEFEEHNLLLNNRNMHAQDKKEEKHKKKVFTFYEFFRRIGQKPELYDTMLVNYSIRQIKVYMTNQGYFNCKVKAEPTFSKKRVNITYKIEAGYPLKISSVVYNFPDSVNNIKTFFDNQNLKFEANNNFDIKKLEDYRSKLAERYRNNGYYYFSKQLISYKIDTINRYRNAILFINFNNIVDKKVYKPWRVRNIYIHNDYEPNTVIQTPKLYYNQLDTIVYYGVKQDKNYTYNLIKKNRFIIKPKFITNELYVYPDSLYSLKNTKNTYTHISKFKIYKLTNIQYEEVGDSLHQLLDCNVMLTPDKLIDVGGDIESTNTSATIGVASHLTFSNNNLFRGGEILQLKLQFAMEKQKDQDTISDKIFFNTQDYTSDLKLTFPRLLLPRKFLSLFNSSFIEQNNPSTIISSLVSYQNRPEFNKIQLMFNYEYSLRSNDFVTHSITPIRISSIRVSKMVEAFRNWMNKAMLQESYENHFIIGSKYSYLFSNQGTEGNNFYMLANFSWSGNMLQAIGKLSNMKQVDSSYILPVFETPFAQFFKFDIDFRYYIKTITNQKIISRLFIGTAVPYGNSKLLPFGEKYFVGGASSIRAWQARTLGPGEYKLPDGVQYSNQTADIKIELNFEYRFNIIKFLEGAIFLDAGNIWAINKYDNRDGGLFYFNKFYKQFGVGTGFGLRLNLNFFVLRTDIGIKLFAPTEVEGSRFIYYHRNFNIADATLNIAIGYPF